MNIGLRLVHHDWESVDAVRDFPSFEPQSVFWVQDHDDGGIPVPVSLDCVVIEAQRPFILFFQKPNEVVMHDLDFVVFPFEMVSHKRRSLSSLDEDLVGSQQHLAQISQTAGSAADFRKKASPREVIVKLRLGCECRVEATECQRELDFALECHVFNIVF